MSDSPEQLADEAKKLVAQLPRIEEDGIVLPYIPEVDVESLVTRLLADNARWKKAIEGLTPSGSEFVDDPERCATYIRERCQYPKMIVDLLADKERLTEALREIVKGVDDWNKAVSKVIQIEEPHVWPGLEHARALIEKASHQP